MTPEQKISLKKLLLSLVPDDGTAVGNKTLSESFIEKAPAHSSGAKVSDVEYWEVRNDLISEGVLTKGRGRGGAVFLTEYGVYDECDGGEAVVVDVQSGTPVLKSDSAETTSARQAEAALYPPFYQTISEYWVRENGIRDYVIEQTSSQGRRVTGGTWTRPDITLISVNKFAFIPGKSVDVTTFEIKPLDLFDIKGVFEAAAHSAFAHRCYFAVHVSENLKPSQNTDFDRIRTECKRFDVGFLTFIDPGDGDTFEIIVEAPRREPDPANVNDFITKQICSENQMQLLEMLK